MSRTPHTCPTCEGRRVRDGEPCPTCQGEGVVWEPVEEAELDGTAGPLDLTGL